MSDNQEYIEPYTSFIRLHNNVVLFSGIKAWGLKCENEIEGNVREQCIDIFTQIDTLLTSAGLVKASIARIQCFLTDIEDYYEFNKEYIHWIGDHRPTRSVIGCYKLRYNAKIELIVDCYVNG